MTTKEEIKEIWKESFSDSDDYVDMFFTEIYNDDDALVHTEDGIIASSLLLQRYAMTFHGVIAPISYICGAATRKSLRGKGCMCALMCDAVKNSYARGDIFSTLIPANEWLFHYYERFGYSPAFYVNIERYTSEHSFKTKENYRRIYDPELPGVYEFFNDMMMSRKATVQHTRRQFHQIVMDNSADGGTIIILANSFNEPVSMAFASPTDDGNVIVKDIFALDDDARNATLAEIHESYPGSSITVLAYYKDPEGYLLPRGMIRVVNVMKCLSILARSYPDMRCSLKIHDDIIHDNNHLFKVKNGDVTIEDYYTGEPDYDIDIEVFTSIVFGNDDTRDILNFPAERPFISLMLD